MTTNNRDLAVFFVDQLGFPTSETNIEQMEELLEVYELFIERNETYSDLWKDYGWMDTLTHIRSKAMRLIRKFWRDDPESDEVKLDDARDLVNYAVFFIRNFKAGNKWGRT